MKTLLRLGQGLACIFCWGETYNLPSYAYADLGFYLSIILKANQLYRIVHDRFKFRKKLTKVSSDLTDLTVKVTLF